jgi:ketosteroid isomerase-like protein
VLAVAACLVILERVVVTEKEEVEDALEAIATSVEANDAQSVLAAFASSSPRRAEVQSALHRVKVSSARIAGDLEVRFNRLGAAPAATAYFTGIIDAKDKTGSIPYEHMMRRFKVTLHKEGDRWLVFDYEDNDRGQGQRGP